MGLIFLGMTDAIRQRLFLETPSPQSRRGIGNDMRDEAHGTVRLAQAWDKDQLAALRASLWPDGSIEEHSRELDATLGTGMSGTLSGAILVSQNRDGTLTGFLEAGLRSHADGCDTSRPVGFVEGWFVREECRKQGVGRHLMRAAEEWARTQGCLEMASDALIDNDESQLAHEALGFEVVDRCVHFRKSL
jgi:aminoglycoside 6'-N-acetyltransferase I